jgi:hypothetical protein
MASIVDTFDNGLAGHKYVRPAEPSHSLIELRGSKRWSAMRLASLMLVVLEYMSGIASKTLNESYYD